MDTDEGMHQLNLTPEILERLKQALKKKSRKQHKKMKKQKTATISPILSHATKKMTRAQLCIPHPSFLFLLCPPISPPTIPPPYSVRRSKSWCRIETR